MNRFAINRAVLGRSQPSSVTFIAHRRRLIYTDGDTVEPFPDEVKTRLRFGRHRVPPALSPLWRGGQYFQGSRFRSSVFLSWRLAGCPKHREKVAASGCPAEELQPPRVPLSLAPHYRLYEERIRPVRCTPIPYGLADCRPTLRRPAPCLLSLALIDCARQFPSLLQPPVHAFRLARIPRSPLPIAALAAQIVST